MYESETATPESTDSKPTESLRKKPFTSPWTPELEAKVTELAEQGLSTKKIAAAVGMTKNQIVGRLWRSHGWPNSCLTFELEARIEELAAQGMNAQKISDAVGMTKNQVVGWLWRNYYDGPTTKDRLDAMHAKMDAARAEWNALHVKGGALYTRMDVTMRELTARLPKPNGRS